MLGADFATIQGVSNVTLAQLFTGIPGLPGTVQFAPVSYTGTEGNSLTVTASRTGGSYGAVSVSYATLPGTAAATRYTPVTGIVAGSNYLTLSFRRVPTAGDLTYTPQSGPALGTWTGVPVQVGSPVTNADGTQTVLFRDSVPITPAATQRFMRLQVTRSP